MHTYFTIVIHAQLRTYGSRFGLITFIVGWQNHKACLSDFDFLKVGTSLRSLWMYVSSSSTKLVQFQLGKSTTFLIGRSNEVMSEDVGASLELQMLNPTKIQIQWHSLPEIYGKKFCITLNLDLIRKPKKVSEWISIKEWKRKITLQSKEVLIAVHFWQLFSTSVVFLAKMIMTTFKPCATLSRVIQLLRTVFKRCCFSCQDDNFTALCTTFKGYLAITIKKVKGHWG